jgi:hypothetical protein
MRTVISLMLLGILGFALAEYDNNPPVPGRRPQFVTGTPKYGIDIEVVYDLMCSDTADLHPIFAKFLSSKWNISNTNVSDAIQVTYTFLPLPYHYEVWISHRLVPFFLDNCLYGPYPCLFMEYLNWSLEN